MGDAVRRIAALLLVTGVVAAVGCSAPDTSSAPVADASSAAPTSAPPPAPEVPRRELASDPARIAEDLVDDERVLRDPSSSEALRAAAAHRQQAAYRALGRHPEWDPVVRPRIPPELLEIYDLNVDARRQLTALSEGTAKDTLPAWRIVAPTPVDELRDYYREAETASGVGWNYLAAINFIETGFGRVTGVSTAGAQGPMQFLPTTFAAYGNGGDILSPRDSIMAAGRYLAANGFAHDRDHALYRYNNSNRYVRAVSDYAAVLAADPSAFDVYHRWDVYYKTTAGDVLLPVGYSANEPIPVVEYLAAHTTPAVQISGPSERILDRLLAAKRDAPRTDPSATSDILSRLFLGTPYGADTLIGSATDPEQLVVELEKVDCFTYADYVEALKRADNRETFVDALIDVRYRDGSVAYQNRKHFFTDWAVDAPALATDVTASLSPDAVAVHKNLNQKDSGGVYLPGLPVVARTVTYIPSDDVDERVLSQLRTGDYIGAFAQDGGLDVTHVGVFVDTPGGPVFRNASSLSAYNKVVDQSLSDYLQTVPGIVVLRPVE